MNKITTIGVDLKHFQKKLRDFFGSEMYKINTL